MKAPLTLGCALFLILAGSASAQDARDVRVSAEIVRAVNNYAHFTIFDDISTNVENGDVLLVGKVTMPFKRAEIEKRLALIEGVRHIRNEIEVLPASVADDELRRRVARAIYGNPSFWNYAARAHPPIHIVVEHGRVTLTGVVNSNVERVLARSLATGLGELSVTNELRTDAHVDPV
jgi:hyperosmotically inducible periplasmic protein